MTRWMFALWICILIGGVSAFARFAFTPGEAATPAHTWPSLSLIQPSMQKPELLVFLHPKCACSHATLTDLERLMIQIGSRARVRLVFNDLGDPHLLRGSHAYAMAQEIKGLEIVIDAGGIESSKFGVKTSGQTFLYDERGDLVFSGGLTPSRGHEGESQGALAVMTWLNSKKIQWETSDVFGCSMKASL